LIQVGLLEISIYLISRTSGIFEFGVHFPLQTSVLQPLLPVWPKSGREGIFEVFLTILEAQNLSKLPSNFWECIIFHEESKNVNFSSRGGPYQKRAPGGATHLSEKTCFSLEKFKIVKKCAKFLEIWHE